MVALCMLRSILMQTQWLCCVMSFTLLSAEPLTNPESKCCVCVRVCVCVCVFVCKKSRGTHCLTGLQSKSKPCHWGQGTGSPAKLACWACSRIMVPFLFLKVEAQWGEPIVPHGNTQGPLCLVGCVPSPPSSLSSDHRKSLWLKL